MAGDGQVEAGAVVRFQRRRQLSMKMAPSEFYYDVETPTGEPADCCALAV